MKYLSWLLLCLIALWTAVILSPYFGIGGIKVNWGLIFLLTLMLQWGNWWLLLYGSIMGLFLDTLSHGLVGTYGLSFFLTLLIARIVSEVFYERHLVSTVFWVFVLSIVEGFISLTLLRIQSQTFSWSSWFFGITPIFFSLNAAIVPLANYVILFIERWLHISPPNPDQPPSKFQSAEY